MKKSLETELKRLAEEIIQQKNHVDVHELKVMAGLLYEKLAVLSFAENHFGEVEVMTTKQQIENALEVQSKKSDRTKNDENEDNDDRYAPDGTQYNPEGITEPNTEKIKDIVAQMPPESEEVDEVLQDLLPTDKREDDFSSLGVHYDDLPKFEPVRRDNEEVKEESVASESKKFQDKEERQKHERIEKSNESDASHPESTKNPPVESIHDAQANGSSHKKSLNDRLKKGVSFGLNDRLLYIKHLFEGNRTDYDRVISQLNTFDSYEEAKKFIDTMVKPDYGFWEAQQSYEKRFLDAIKAKL